jgi:hypothetical protein
VARSGVVASGSRGQPRLAQTVVELRQARLALSRLLGELSLPSSAEEPDPAASLADDVFDDLLAGRPEEDR